MFTIIQNFESRKCFSFGDLLFGVVCVISWYLESGSYEPPQIADSAANNAPDLSLNKSNENDFRILRF
ncbi:unnamed protein product [Acanthoscelides obtectus]|uniref:Uncharacterized protein n=1 Tax=Acanthoscelides obtectus TaxID=200917 RepID=A0A9P0QB24_ACAOB|nr:unnamed protein product [Acanthoscelides obtectus]CAK1641064.1 hypothetical protein AOBTE_LOCUS12119 [Acanthoscelides obtectus]